MTKIPARASQEKSQRTGAQRTATTVLAPGRIAFLGSASATDAAGSVYVQAMCWAAIPDAWATLACAWQSVHSMRDEIMAYVTAPATPASWISVCAPQLSAPFRDTTAEESSVAALITRTPVQIAVTVVEIPRTGKETKATAVSAQRHAFANNLAVYDSFLRAPGRHAYSMLVSRIQSAEAEREYREELALCQLRMSGTDWIRDLELRAWKEPVEPLPLELAHVIATSVVRHRHQEELANPVFDAVLAKLVHAPFQVKRHKHKRR
jgi:hypothetical protein